MRTHLPFLIAAFLLIAPALAAPTSEQARNLVQRVIDYSLLDLEPVKTPAEWEAIKAHPGDFSPELFDLMEWVNDGSKQGWQYGVDPLWQLQTGAVKNLKIGNPRTEGDLQLITLDYESPSVISKARPSTFFHNVWVVSELNGKVVLTDVRYHIKHPAQTDNGNLLTALRKARAGYKAP